MKHRLDLRKWIGIAFGALALLSQSCSKRSVPQSAVKEHVQLVVTEKVSIAGPGAATQTVSWKQDYTQSHATGVCGGSQNIEVQCSKISVEIQKDGRRLLRAAAIAPPRIGLFLDAKGKLQRVDGLESLVSALTLKAGPEARNTLLQFCNAALFEEMTGAVAGQTLSSGKAPQGKEHERTVAVGPFGNATVCIHQVIHEDSKKGQGAILVFDGNGQIRGGLNAAGPVGKLVILTNQYTSKTVFTARNRHLLDESESFFLKGEIVGPSGAGPLVRRKRPVEIARTESRSSSVVP